MNTGKLMAIGGLAVAIACMSACRIRPRVATMEPRFKETEIDYIADKRVSVPSSFRRVFSVDYMNRAKTPEGILKVQLRVANRTKTPQVLQYKFQWIDKEGMAITTPTPRWVISHIQPGESAFIGGVAPSTDVGDFIVNMKQHRPRRN